MRAAFFRLSDELEALEVETRRFRRALDEVTAAREHLRRTDRAIGRARMWSWLDFVELTVFVKLPKHRWLREAEGHARHASTHLGRLALLLDDPVRKRVPELSIPERSFLSDVILDWDSLTMAMVFSFGSQVHRLEKRLRHLARKLLRDRAAFARERVRLERARRDLVTANSPTPQHT